MKIFNKHLKSKLITFNIDLLIIIFLIIFLPLFLYNLGSFSLVDFDEAWYAEIARNILKYHQPLLLSFNGSPFNDHPPLGFNLMAISFIIFGINEFAARFPSAITGFSSLILVYFIGKKMFNRTVGFGASLIMVSCVWFIFRSRSGNLDSVFLFFYLLCFFLGIKAGEKKYFWYLFSVAFACLVLTKSILGLSIIIPVVIYLVIIKKTPKRKTLILSFLLFLLMLTPWILVNYATYGSSYFVGIYNIGMKTATRIPLNFTSITSSNTYLYLHYGMEKWFYPALVSLTDCLLLVFKNKKLLALYSIIGILIYGFLTNKVTSIWHLIPLYPFLALFISYFIYQIIYLPFKRIPKYPHIPTAIYCIFFVSVCFWQINRFKDRVKLFDHGISSLAYVAQAAKNKSEPLYLDGHDILPSAVFYSQKINHFIRFEKPPANTLKGFIEYGPKPSLILTENWRLETDKIPKEKYETIAVKDNFILIKLLNRQ